VPIPSPYILPRIAQLSASDALHADVQSLKSPSVQCLAFGLRCSAGSIGLTGASAHVFISASLGAVALGSMIFSVQTVAVACRSLRPQLYCFSCPHPLAT